VSLIRYLSPSESYPCPVCDYIFTLAVSFAYASLLWWCGIPWWFIVAVVHWQTSQWFLETRK
jgi:hypothetical protein